MKYIDKSKIRPSFLDNQSTNPLDPRVLDSMLPFLSDMFGNPHSRSHAYGWEAEEFVEISRKFVADIIGANPKNIIFTSGATEANNLAIQGVARFYRKMSSDGESKQKNHIITTQIEHKCVLASCRFLEEMEGFDVTYLPVDNDGLVDLRLLEESIRPSTILLSVMHVNNEIGVIQNIKEIGAICRRHKIFFHTDAAQSVGKLPIDVDDMNIDLLSMSAHKMYGPKGIGALYIKSKPRVRLQPIIQGGGQERGFRSGTLPSALIVGFGEACRIALIEREYDHAHIKRLADKLISRITEELPEVKLNGSRTQRYHGNINFSFAFVEGESLLMSLKNTALSSGSACTSASLEPSYVLRSIGVDEELAHTSVRFGIGRFTTYREVENCVEELKKHVKRLRDLSPLYELSKDSNANTVRIWT